MNSIDQILRLLIPDLLKSTTKIPGNNRNSFVTNGINYLPYSAMFNTIITRKLEKLLKSSSSTYNHEAAYDPNSQYKKVLNKIPDDHPLWYCIRRKYPLALNRTTFNVDEIIKELMLNYKDNFIRTNSLNGVLLYVNQPPLKDIRIFEIINKHRKPINLERF